MKSKVPATGERLVLLDAHAILHRAYHALPDFSTGKGEPTGALYGLSAMLLKIVEDLKPDYMIACYDLKGPTHRHEMFKEYKAQRKQIDDDLIAQIERSRDIFTAFGIPIYDKQGFEADDILGTIVEKVIKAQKAEKQRSGDEKKELSHPNLEVIIASGDMDTLQLVHGSSVKAYTLKKGLNDTVMYDEKAVKARFGFGPELIPDYKGLRGDPSDNIPGVKGVGEKTATTLITTFGSIENMYKELESEPSAQGEGKFKAAGISPRIIQLLKDNKEEAEFSKMLATIRRDVPIDFVLPEKTFRDNLDAGKVKALWATLEFRTLGARLDKVMVGKNSSEPSRQKLPEDIKETRANDVVAQDKSLFGSFTDPADLEKTAVALWLVNSNITNPKLEDILAFAATDDYETAKKAIFVELDERGLRKVYEEIELPLIPVLHSMEKRGIKADRAVLKELSTEYHKELSILEKKIWQHAGSEFNINSPKQLGEILFDKLGLKAKNQRKTAGGARSTRESELEKLRDLHPVVALILDYRELSKLLSTYIDAIPPLLDADDRLHTHYIQSGASTGRMASENPNMQNIPIKSDLGRAIRQAFVAEKGFKLAAFDYSQMELRIAAFMSGDDKLLTIFKNGEDVHSSVASFVFKVPLDRVTPEMRRRAKTINFGIIYGMGVTALQKSLGTTRTEAQTFLNDYFAAFSTLAAYLDSVKAEANRKGYTETFFGRRRYFEGIKSKIDYVRAAAERMAVNAPLQGTGADIIKLAMVHVAEYIREEKLEDDVFPLLQVHDELIYEIRDDGKGKFPIEKVAATILDIMQSVISREKTKGVVLEAKASLGENWGQLK